MPGYFLKLYRALRAESVRQQGEEPLVHDCQNKCRDYYKKQTPLYMADVPERETGECVEEEVVVRQMVMELPEEFREAVVLRYFQNLKYTDMAVILQVSTSLVKYRVKKGLELLSAMEGGGHGKKKD